MKGKKGEQKGIALIVALLMLLAFSVLGVAAVNITNVETKVTQNTQTSKQAFYLSEAGLEVARELLRGRIAGLSTVANELITVKGSDGLLNSGDDISYVNTTSLGTGTFKVNLTNDPDEGVSNLTDGNNRVALTAYGFGRDNSKAVIQTIVQVSSFGGGIDPAFNAGILTNGFLLVNGSASIQGNIHANTTVSFNGSALVTGNVSAHSTISTNGSITITGTETPQAPLVNVPSVSMEKFDSLRNKAQTEGGIYYSTSHTYNGAGNLAGKIIFCDGNLTINGSFSNGSLVATGNVTVNGASQIDGGVIDTAIIAGGKITMNGSSSSYGVFWSNGSFVQNGSSTVTGSIVSVGNITRNGTFNFVSNNNIENDNLPQTPGNVTVSVISWKQL